MEGNILNDKIYESIRSPVSLVVDTFTFSFGVFLVAVDALAFVSVESFKGGAVLLALSVMVSF